MSRKSPTALARYRATRRAQKKAGQAAAKQPQELEILVHEHGLMSEETKHGWWVEHHAGYCRGERNGCPHCGNKPE